MARKRYATLSKMGDVIADLLGDYNRQVDAIIIKGTPKAAEVFRQQAIKTCIEDEVIDHEAARKSPYGYYKDNWVIKDTQTLFTKYVGNKKKVKAHAQDIKETIPLINILEYGTHNNSHPHLNKAIKASKQDVINVYINLLERG